VVRSYRQVAQKVVRPTQAEEVISLLVKANTNGRLWIVTIGPYSDTFTSLCSHLLSICLHTHKSKTTQKTLIRPWHWKKLHENIISHFNCNDNMKTYRKFLNVWIPALVHMFTPMSCLHAQFLKHSTVALFLDAVKTCSIRSSRYPFLAHGLLDVTRVRANIFPSYLPTHNLTASLHYTFWSRRWGRLCLWNTSYLPITWLQTVITQDTAVLRPEKSPSSQTNQYMMTTSSKTSSIMTVMTSILHASLPSLMMLNCNSEYFIFKCMNLNF
jgi:hypothetical protein